MYIKRHIESAVGDSARMFPAVVLTGPRQVGKTTLLTTILPQATAVTLDRLDNLDAALDDPETFLRSLQTPALIDEVQYAPSLFRYLKIAIDASRAEKGRFFLTGSQRYLMMQGLDESLAGRVGTVEMLGLSLREMTGCDFRMPFAATEEYLMTRRGHSAQMDIDDIWELIYRGDLPELYADRSIDASRYYAAYIDTYLRRDVRGLAHVGDLSSFNRFMVMLALLHGQQLNKVGLAARAGISVPTVTRWLSVLEAANIVYLLKPFYANSNKRLVKTPKLYFLNPGIAARLLNFSSAVELQSSIQAGAFFEGFVLTEIIKGHLNAGLPMPDLYYCRDTNGNEVDLVLCDGLSLYPVEIKSSSLARSADTAKFKLLDSLAGFQRQPGMVVCNCAQPLPLGDGSWACPASYL